MHSRSQHSADIGFAVVVIFYAIILCGHQSPISWPVVVPIQPTEARYVVMDTAHIGPSPLCYIISEWAFRDSTCDASYIMLVAADSTRDSTVIRPGDVVFFSQSQGYETVTLPNDTVYCAHVGSVIKTCWIQQHREPNWPRLRTGCRLRFTCEVNAVITERLQSAQLAHR